MSNEYSYRDRLKDNPIKMGLSVIAAVSFIITSVWAVDDRWNQDEQIHQLEDSIQAVQVMRLEDKIFELDLKEASGKANEVDKALNLRFKSRLRRFKSKE